MSQIRRRKIIVECVHVATGLAKRLATSSSKLATVNSEQRMISIISPAKSMSVDKKDRFKNDIVWQEKTDPVFAQQTEAILQELQACDIEGISNLMGVSKKIAELNHGRFQHFTKLELKQALIAFDGDVYVNMKRNTYNKKDIAFAQEHLCILSGFYGMLRPCDMIRPYRLEMSKKLPGIAPTGMDAFWRNKVTSELKTLIALHADRTLVNLASNEYSKAIDFEALRNDYVNIHFREIRNGEIKNIALNAKKARGMFADYIIKNHIDKTEDLKNFITNGYNFATDLSSKKDYFFVRMA